MRDGTTSYRHHHGATEPRRRDQPLAQVPRANGKRRTVPLGAVSRDAAERQLGFVLADAGGASAQPPLGQPVDRIDPRRGLRREVRES